VSSSSPELSGRPRRTVCAQVRREEPNCWLCGLPIDLSLPRWPKPHPMSSVIDEVIPRSKHPRGAYFAAHDRANMRHAHRECNGRRGARIDYVQPVRSRRW
jgi:5-methylcytosine-specific restriction endonuclease McrA